MSGEDAEAGKRMVKAILITGGVGLVFAAIAMRGCVPGTGGRFVQVASPEQVAPPGHEPKAPPPRDLATGDHVPDLALPDLAGRMTSLASWRGHVLVLNVWASWCPPCREEMPSLERLARNVPNGVVLVGVSVDQDRTSARTLVEKDGLTFPILLDQGGDRLAQWGTVKYPETWVISPSGTILARYIGPSDWSSPETRGMLERVASGKGGA